MGKVRILSIEKFESILKYEELHKDGYLMSLQDFINDVKSGGLSDYDGWGYLVYKDKQVADSTTDCNNMAIVISKKDFLMDSFLGINNGEDFKINWFNK